MDATATATGNFSDPQNWDIKISGKTLKEIEQDRLMRRVNAMVDMAEDAGKCKRLPFGQIEWLDKTI